MTRLSMFIDSSRARLLRQGYRRNNMTLSISPIHTIDFGDGGWTLEKKIEVFAARVEGWQLNIAWELREREIAHRGFAQLHILLSYFEMIAKYRYGHTTRSSKAHFRQGFLEVFPLLEELNDDQFEPIIDLMYANVRSGMYHTGLVGQNVILTGEITSPLEFNTSTGILHVNPDRLTDTLFRHFGKYKEQLANPDEKEIRENFEKRFDFDTRAT